MREAKGELVCRAPFPSMPIGFWNDPDGSRYRAAYFSRFDGVWAHGDYAEWTAHHGIMIHGRSDATLNPGGVRIGTAEIYAVVEELPEIDSALCIGQQWENDTRVVLFIKLAPGAALDEALAAQDPLDHPQRRQPAPCAGQGDRGGRPAAHPIGQADRTGGARRGTHGSAGPQCRGARQPGAR